MIVQGTNVPIEILFDGSVADLPVLIASAWAQSGSMLKKWEKDDMEISADGKEVLLPLTEEETAAWPTKTCGLEVKGMNEDGMAVFWQIVELDVMFRHDRAIRMQEVSA